MGTHHAKFTNYSFDMVEFMRLMVNLGQDVRQRKMAAYSSLSFNLETNAETSAHPEQQINIHEEL